MKRFLTALALLALPFAVQAQSIRVSLNLTPNPSPYLSDWTSRRETAIVTIVNGGTTDVEVKLRAKVLIDGALQADTKVDKLPVLAVHPGINTFYGEDLVPASAVTFHGDVDRTVVRSGRLPSGSYLFCVEVIDPATQKALSAEQCRPMTIRSYQSPQILSPASHAKIPPPLVSPTLRWTPVGPHYSAMQRYEVVVMEVLAGQSPAQAFRANRPILERDIRSLTSVTWPSDVPLDTPMTYVWSVRALDDAGNPIGDTKDGWAQPSTFTMAGEDGGAAHGDTRSQRTAVALGLADSSIAYGDLYGPLQTLTMLTPADGETVYVTEDTTVGRLHRWVPLRPLRLRCAGRPRDTCNPPRDDCESDFGVAIAEVLPGQSPIAAVRDSRLFKARGIETRGISYPDAAPALEPGRQYAWTLGRGTARVRPLLFHTVAVEESVDIRIEPGIVLYTPMATTRDTLGRDCSAPGSGCAEVFSADHPSQRWLDAMKTDSAATLRATQHPRATVRLFTSLPNPDTLPGTAYGDGNPDNCPRCPVALKLTLELTPDSSLLLARTPDSSVKLVSDFELSPELCTSLGIDTARIPNGEYPLSMSIGASGGVEFPTTAIVTTRSNIKHGK